MSKCDLAIRFDHPDRQYNTGDKVTGVAFVRVNKDVKCNGLVVSALWRTHGRGNRSTDEYYSQVLTSGQWSGGQEYQFPFEIPAPDHPLTYHGTYLNIDHYVKLRVDIPWAFDPKLEEEFLLSPGKGHRYQDHIDKLPELGQAASNQRTVLVIVGGSFFALGIALLFLVPSFVPVILIVIGALILALNLRRVLAERLVGPVEVRDLSRELIPNTSTQGELVFTPRKSKPINAISVELQGNEICVSGSGSNKTTHRHRLWNDKIQLASNIETQAGVPVRVPIEIGIPATYAYTVKLGDNKIEWKAIFHIDIPDWPDWVNTETVHIVPHPDGVQRTGSDQIAGVSQLQPDGKSPPAVPIPAAIPVTPQDNTASQPTIPMPSIRNDLVDITRQLLDCDRFNDEATKIVDMLATDLFQIEVVVDRISPTHGYFEDARYEDGQTVIGSVKGTDTYISIQLPRDYNEELESVGHGQIWTGQGVIIKWDGLYERLEMMGF